VLVTRTRAQASELSRLLAEAGAEPVELPAIEIRRTSDPASVAAAIDALRTSAYQWAVFTSANAAGLFFEHLAEAGFDARAFGRARLAAIGAGTAQALARHGVRPDLVPQRYIAEGLAEAFAGHNLRGQRVLLPRAEGARETIVDALRGQGATVDELTLYVAAVPADRDAEGLRRLRDGEIDVATFASSSAVRNLLAMLHGDAAPLRAVTIAAIGPITARAVEEAGLRAEIVAETHTVEGLVDALVAACAPAAEPAPR
jgi:uroporphyrinogen III methyltransferase/synthase